MLLRSSDGLSVTAPVDGGPTGAMPGPAAESRRAQGGFIFRALTARVRRLDGELPERRQARRIVTLRAPETFNSRSSVKHGLGDRPL